MVSRLVLGCGTVGQTLVEEIADGPGSLLVIDDAENRIEALREEGVSATLGDPTDAETVEGGAESAGVVVVADDEPEVNRRAAEVAADLFPEAYLVAYAGHDPSDDQRFALSAIADRTVDPT